VIARRFSLLQKLTALAPLLLLVVVLPGQLMLRCRIDGTLRPACCCAHDGTAGEANATAKPQDCCDPEVASVERPPAEAARPPEGDLGVAPSDTLASAPAPAFAPVQLARGAQRHGPPREGPRLILAKHSFLI
jgi:hypothetical protein